MAPREERRRQVMMTVAGWRETRSPHLNITPSGAGGQIIIDRSYKDLSRSNNHLFVPEFLLLANQCLDLIRWGKGQKHISCNFSILFLKAFMSYRTWLVDENKLLSKNLTICCNPLGAEPPKLRCGGFPDVEASDCARAQQIGIPPTI